MSDELTARPVQLQVNTNGAWKTVLRFDASDKGDWLNVRLAVAQLHEADPESSWRIATQCRPTVVLSHLGKSTYGIWMDAR